MSRETARIGDNGTGEVDRRRIEGAVGEVLAYIGEDPSREGLVETPKRVAESCEFIFSGLRVDPERYIEESFEGDFRDEVVIKDIPLYSMCEHHLLPFIGKAHVGYAPDGRVVGLSEIARIVEAYARRPQLQERLTAQVADLLFEPLGSRGSIVVIEAEQLCMTMRGVQKPGSTTITTAARGVYEEDSRRAGFTSLIT